MGNSAVLQSLDDQTSLGLNEHVHGGCFAAAGLSGQQDWILPRNPFDAAVQNASRLAMRFGDVVLAAVLILLSAPIWLAVLANVLGGNKALAAISRLGRRGRVFVEYRIATSQSAVGRMLRRWCFDQAPVLLNILFGDMSFVGPRRVSPGELDMSDRAAQRRLVVRPGLVCLWWLWRRANIAYGSELDADLQYVASKSLLGDLGILLRSIPALLLGAKSEECSRRVDLFGIRIDNMSMDESVEAIAQRLDGDEPTSVFFVNAHYVNVAMRNRDHLDALRKSSFVFADGVGIKLAGRILGKPIRENLCGTDLFPRLCRRMEGTGKRLFLLGARPGTAERVAQWIHEHYPGVTVCGAHHGYFAEQDEPEVIRQIRKSRADLLVVGFGAPRQEVWIRQHIRETGAAVAIGVGGLFDVIAGNLTRPPLWIREICMEWAYRLCHEPVRLWRRYLIGNGVFLVRALAHRIRLAAFSNAIAR